MKHHLNTIVTFISNNLQVHTYFLLIVEIFSSAQLLHIILKSTFSSTPHFNYIFSSTLINLTSLSGTFEILYQFNFPILFLPIYYTITAYFSIYCITLLTLTLFQTKKGFNGKETCWRIISLAHFLHSRLAYFPIQYYLFSMLFRSIKCSINKVGLSYCDHIWTPVTLLLCILNFAFASTFEFFLYQINKSRSGFSVKTNALHQLMLLHKSVAVIIFTMIEDARTMRILCAVIHLILSITYLSILYRKIPFYNIKLLKASTIAISFILSCSIISILQLMQLKGALLEIFLLILLPLIMKICISFMNRLSQQILRGGHRTPEQAIHFAILLKSYMFTQKDDAKRTKEFSFDHLVFQAIYERKIKGISPSITNTDEVEERVYLYIIKKLNLVFDKNPKSKLLLLFLAKIYLKRLGNIPQAVDLIRNIETSGLDTITRNSLQGLNTLLEASYSKVFTKDDKLDPSKYFECRNKSNSIKEEIKSILQVHLSFWQELQSGKTKVNDIINIANKIDTLAIQIQRNYQESIQEFKKSFIPGVIIYEVYLKIVQDSIDNSEEILHAIFGNLNHNHVKHDLSAENDELAVILTSIEKDRYDVILDVSKSAEAFFNIQKSHLKGLSLKLLFPSTFARFHMRRVKKYLETTAFNVGETYKSYAKSIDGRIFEVEIGFYLYSDPEKGVLLLSLLKKIPSIMTAIIVDSNGAVIEYDKGLENLMEQQGIEFRCNRIQDICSEFHLLNLVFNAIYGKNDDIDAVLLSLIDRTVDKNVMNPLDTKALKKYEGMSSVVGEIQNILLMRSKNPTKSEDLMICAFIKEKFRTLCDEFIQKANTLSYSFEEMNLNTTQNIQIQTQIDPYFFNKEVYKVIKLSGFENKNYHEKLQINHSFAKFKTKSSNTASFLEVFPTAEELPLIGEEIKIVKTTTEGIAGNSSPVHKKTLTLSFKAQSQTSDFSNASKSLPLQSKSLKFYKNFKKDVAKAPSIHQEMSVSSSVASRKRVFKQLSEIFSTSSSFPLSKITLLIVYIVLICIASLAAINFFVSRNAISQIGNDINIVNTANSRLTAVMGCYESIMRMYLRLSKISVSNPLIDSLKPIMMQYSLDLMSTNSDLNDKLAVTSEKSQIQQVFDKNINFWSPFNGTGIPLPSIDIFIASTVLGDKFKTIAQFTGDQNVLINRSDVLFLINNTANDYLIRSEDFILMTQDILASTIQNNVFNLKVILGFAIVILLVLSICLIVVGITIVRSYRDLFNVLFSVSEKNINERINQLNKVKVILNEDIEDQVFIQSIFQHLQALKMNGKVKEFKKLSFMEKRSKYSIRLMVFSLVKYIGLALVLTEITSAVFIKLLVESTEEFSYLQTRSNQLSITTRAGYGVGLLTSNFYLEMIFYNRTGMLLREQSPRTQLTYNLEDMNRMNYKFLSYFTQNQDPDDIIINEVLQTTLCDFLPAANLANCIKASRGQKLGALAFNSNYAAVTSLYINLFLQKPIFTYSVSIVTAYVSAMRPTLESLQAGYAFLNSYIQSVCDKKIDQFLSKKTLVFIGLFSAVVLIAILINLYTVRGLRHIDMSRGRILKLIPQRTMKENKEIFFYLMKAFGKERSTIKRLF